ncbi:MAG: 4-hydroxythreonine-4-phosphate dehydrogenase PdxA [Deltaproteobacteria bacterium]|nr:4-hydroxythreonine-4-phosphate dehydrogenase PdxA [Deltaproteobacteria bacterium]
MKKKLPLIGVTMGDPQGVGPEVVQKALRSSLVWRSCRPIVFGDPHLFSFRESKRLTARQCGILSAHFIRQAATAALKKEIDAIVTAPISKERLHKAGYLYPGHTEFLAGMARIRDVRMMMTGPHLTVVLHSIHIPIKNVAPSLKVKEIAQTIELTDQALKKWFRLRRPRIAIAALNPHAGEGGAFGDEEKKLIEPAVQKARRKEISAFGPYAPDTIFCRAVRGEFDAIVAMYHDQGLIPLKLLDFDRAVNLTIGLPFIRTSVDHGTAFDIAGKGKADPRSMIEAILLAAKLATLTQH